jgi:hypothetical protein
MHVRVTPSPEEIWVLGLLIGGLCSKLSQWTVLLIRDYV